MPKRHRSEFLKELKALFPQLTHELNQEYGLLHLEVHTFTRFVQSLIDAGEKEELVKAFQLVEKYMREGNAALANALGVSFLEHLNFTDGKVPRQWAEALLPPYLKAQYDDLMAYNERLRNLPPPKKRK